MESYYERENQVVEIAAAKWEALHPGTDRTASNARRAFIRDQITEWFYTTELYSSITVKRDRVVEIEDNFYGSSITVYPPRREYEYSGDQKKIKVLPAYINASTWNTGRGEVQEVQRHTMHYLKMMQIAIAFQNEMNQAIAEWEDMENPFRDAQYYKEKYKNMLAHEQARKAEEDEKKAARQAKKIPTANTSSQTK